MRKIILSIAAVVFLASNLFATTIKEIKFDGLIHMSSSTANEIVDIKVGDELNYEKIDKSVKKLYEQGYFKDILVDESNGVVTFKCIEKSVIAKLDIIGYKESDKDKFEEFTGLKKGDILDDAKLEKAKYKLKNLIESSGYYDTVVETEVEKLNDNAVHLKFLVKKGENIIIKKVNFYGANDFDAGDFNSKIINKEEEFMGWMWGRNDGEVKAEQLEYDQLRLKEFYMQEGYLDATISAPFLRVYYENYTAKLDYSIVEGEPYILNSIKLEANPEILSEEKFAQMKEDFQSIEGKNFNSQRLRDDMEAIKTFVADQGYAYVRVIPNIDKNSEKHITDVTISVIEGKKVYVNDVIISGNSRTVDRAIRRELYLAPGSLYSLTDLKESKNAVKRTGYFDNAEITEQRVSDDKIDLIVNVTEARTGDLLFGVGYGSYDGMILSGSIRDRNIFGSGKEIGINAEVSGKTQDFDIYYKDPRIFDSRYSLYTRIYNNYVDFYDWEEEKLGYQIVVGKQLTKHISASLGYEIFNSEVTDSTSTLIANGEQVGSVVTPTLSFDNTDDYYIPRSGIKASSSLEYAGVGGDLEYIKSITNFKYFYSLQRLVDYDLILRYRAKLAYGIDNGNFPSTEKFYLGGVSTVRGYKSKSISPVDSAANLLGGKEMFSNSIEASIPLVESLKMRVALFYDWGMIGEDSFSDMTRSGTGVQLEWNSPLGPLNLVFAQALDDEPGDRTSSFEFSLGGRF